MDRAPNAKSTGIRRIPLRAAVVTGPPLSADAFPPTHCILGLRLLARYVPWRGVRVSCLVVWYLVWFGMVVCPTPSGVSSGGRGWDWHACVILVQAPSKRQGLRLVLGSWWIDRSLDDDDDDVVVVVVVVVVGKEGMLTDRRANRWLVGCGMMMNRRTHTKKRKKKRTHKDGRNSRHSHFQPTTPTTTNLTYNIFQAERTER